MIFSTVTTRRSLKTMTTRLMSGGMRSPEAAERLGVRGRDVYMLLFAGELDGGPGRDGMVYFDEASLEAYLDRHGFGNVSNNLSNESRRTGPDDGGHGSTGMPADEDEHGSSRTKQHRPGPDSMGS